MTPRCTDRARKIRGGLALGAVLLTMGATGCGTRQHRSGAALPATEQREVHRTFHRLPAICGPGRRDERALARVTARFITLYHRYSADRYSLRFDGESGTMLSVTLVLRDALRRCHSVNVAAIDDVLPPRVRRALRPVAKDRTEHRP